MAYDVARVRGLHPSLGDGWVHFDAPAGMLIPDSVATTVSTAFRRSSPSVAGAHPSAQRSAGLEQTFSQAAQGLRQKGLKPQAQRLDEACRRTTTADGDQDRVAFED